MDGGDHPAWAPTRRPDLQTFVPRDRRVGPLVLWLTALLAALALLVWLGGGELASPDLTAPSTWADWAAARGTAATVVAVLRMLSLALAWYLVGVTSVSVLAHAARATRLVRVADALSVGPVRTVVQQALGVSLAVGLVTTTLPPQALGRGESEPVVASSATASAVVDPVRRPTADPVPATPGGAAPSVTEAWAAGSRVPVPAPAIGAGARAGGIADAPARAGGAATDEPVGGVREVRVEAGDHLWGIAEGDLRRALGREPSEAEVVGHWRRVIAANTDRLVVPSNPDLLHPGQRLVLPAVEVVP